MHLTESGWARPVSLIALFLSVLAALVSLRLVSPAWLGLASLPRSAMDVAVPAATSVAQLIAPIEARVAQAEQAVAKASTDTTQARDAARAAIAQRDEMTRGFERLSRQLRDTSLSETSDTIAVAAAQLQAGAPPGAVLLLLRPTQARLQAAASPTLSGIVVALDKDIAGLEAAVKESPAQSLALLDDLINQSSSLALRPVAKTEGQSESKPRSKPESKPTAPVLPQGQSSAPAQTTDGVVAPGASADADGWWSRLQRKTGELLDLDQAGKRLRDMVSVTRADGADANVLLPLQAELTRLSLRTSLLNARLALLARNAPGVRVSLRAGEEWLAAHFDNGDVAVEQARRQIRELAQREMVVPDISATVAAVNAAQAQQGNK